MLGSPPTESELYSNSTISARLHRLHEIDCYQEMLNQEKQICKDSQYGFPVNIFSVSDDTQQCGKTWHGFGITGKDADG